VKLFRINEMHREKYIHRNKAIAKNQKKCNSFTPVISIMKNLKIYCALVGS